MTAPCGPAPFTKAEALHYLLGIHCPSCSAVVSGPGLPCESCGKIPPVTAPAAEKMLDSATDIAAVQQKVLEAEAEALYQASMEKWQDAAQVVHVARLRDQFRAAQKAYDEHQRKHGLRVAARTRAGKAEAEAAAALEPQAAAVTELAGAVKLAKAMDHGVKAVAQARYLHDTADEELEPYRDDLAKAASKWEAADNVVTASKARGDQLKKALADARADLASPGTAPLGDSPAVIASPWRMLQEGKLQHDGAAMDLVGEIGQAICDLTGRTEEIVAEARKRQLAEREQAAKDQPLIRRSDGVVIGNPLNPATPQPFQPPARGSQPSPVQPAVMPGW